MDRLEEFKEIIEKIQIEKKEKEFGENEPILRNRNSSKKPEFSEIDEANLELFNFSKTFLSECSLINSTLIQLTDKLKKLSQKSDQISFSITTATSPKADSSKEIEEALNICSMNVSIMRRKLQDFVEKSGKRKGSENVSMFASWFKTHTENVNTASPIHEHLRLVLSFLEGRIGRITEELEAYKTRRRNREMLMNQSTIRINQNSSNQNVKSTFSSQTSTSKPTPSVHQDDHVMSMLQVENTRMLEEMSRGLFETLNTTESQVLELSRLQATLQSHLTIQHDLTCRLFEDSISTVEDTKKGNEYLRRSGKEGSLMRKFLVTLILFMSLLLLLLHYFNK